MNRLPGGRLLLLRLCLLACIGATSAQSQVVLKPNGLAAAPLRTKSMEANVAIDGQFASTHLTLTFQNETSERIEADFIYTIPRDSLVTSFAYWYGDEKVVAKIVEKEEAAAIYSHITTRMRDPALVEMIGKNTFRARIFPVMPNSDLKVEMNLVQTLSSDPKGMTYTFPLKAQKGDALEALHLKVHIQADTDILKVTNANGLPVSHDGNGVSIRLDGTNYRPQQDVRVHVARKEQPLQTSLAAGRIGGGDGYFALALTPDRDMKRPKVAIGGVQVYSVVSSLPPVIHAHTALTLFGRYKGSGPATVTLTGTTENGLTTVSRSLLFSAVSAPDNLASKLWAAGRMAQLSRDYRNRASVISLSKQYGLPGKYTSWLAVPREEMERYEQEIAQAKCEMIARRLSREITMRRENSAVARRLRKQLEYWCKKGGLTPAEAMSEQLNAQIDELALRLGRTVASGQGHSGAAKRIRARLKRLCREAGRDPKEALRDGLYTEIDGLAATMASDIAQGRDNSPAYRRMRTRLLTLCRVAGSDASQALQNQLYGSVGSIAERIVDERHRSHPDRQVIAALAQRFHHLEKACGKRLDDFLTGAESSWTYREINNVRDQLYAEHLKTQPDDRKIKPLEQRFLALYGRDNRTLASARVERLKVHADQEKLVREIEAATQNHSTQLAVLEKRQATLRKREDELRARMGDPLISVAAPADAQQVIALMPGGEIKRLTFNPVSRQWEARFDIPAYAAEGEYRIQIVIVTREGARSTQTIHYHVDLTPPTVSGHARTVISVNPSVRLELEGGADTARVKAILSWGEIVELQPAATPHHFFAIVPVPRDVKNAALAVTYVVTDQAHNRTTITVDLK